ncbi:MAG: type I glutamate--ammonia ligase, partial [Clostridia bacterium]|nr:type I glutamate--ammonia ligase [Clostridia bacterium]
EDLLESFMAGVLEHIEELTFFLNPTEDSYKRFGEKKAPIYITWSSENRDQLILIPDCPASRRHMKLRSPDSGANPYIAYALLIYAGVDGIRNGRKPAEPVNFDPAHDNDAVLSGLKKLPLSLTEARQLALNSTFVRDILGEDYLKLF